MKPRNIEAIYRLTPLQEGLLFHTLEATTSGAYFDQYCAFIHDDVNTETLRRAWQEIVAHNAILRTFFTWEKREHPLQVVRASVELPFDSVDLRGFSKQDQDQNLADYLRADRQAGFVLDQAPLMRVRLSRLADKRVHMAWSFHHLILDGWSVRLLLAELQQRYAALSRGDVFSSGPAPTFEQFVSWQRACNAESAERYWQEYLGGFAVPSTPRVNSARSTGTETALQARMTLPQDLHERLTAFARKSRVTLNTLFVAAWGLVLSRYCDQQDVVFGTTAAGRPPALQGIERTAGLFITTLPVRIRFEAGRRVDQLLDTLQKDQARHREYDYVGLNIIQKISDVPAGVPLFETLLVFENFPAFEKSNDAAFKLEQETFNEYSHYPLALLVVPGQSESRSKDQPKDQAEGESDGLSTELIAVHQPERYSSVAVERILANVAKALQELISSHYVNDIDVLGVHERDYLLEIGRGPEMEPKARSVLDEFERCARDSPDSIALTVGSETFTYADINARAGRIAQELVSGEYALSRAVVIVCERNQWATVAQLAAMKAGKVYVTLDVKDPESRVDFVLSDVSRAFGSGSTVTLVTTEHIARSRNALGEAHHLLYIERLSTGTGKQIRHRHEVIAPETPAYIIYTSGSTGRPKGVLVSHGSLINSTLARNHYYPHAPRAFALLSSLATDSAIAGVFWTLCTGGTVVMPAERAELDVAALLQLFVRCDVTHTLCVPSLYALMLDALESVSCPSLEAVIVAGEACPLSLVRRHYSELENVSLYNEYGPSEACVWATVALLTGDDSSVPIGMPIINTQVAVLDSLQRLSPAGVIGELYIGGANLALEYINQPQATEASFMQLPLPQPRRFYRTGDKVVVNENHQLEYLGRVDNQLKIRGFRVEPGEIEAALSLHSNVEAAVVLVDESDIDAALIEIMATAQATQTELLERTLSDIETMGDLEVERALDTLGNHIK